MKLNKCYIVKTYLKQKRRKKKGERLSMKKIIEIRKFQYKRIVNKQTEKS